MLKGTTVDLQQLLKLRPYARGIDLLRSKRVATQRHGVDTSAFRGRGMDFDEVRVYQPGDEMRHVHWRVTAKTGVPHTKLYREERERPLIIVVDYSATMQFATRVAYKSVIAAEAASLIAWAGVAQGYRTGGLVFNGEQQFESALNSREQGAVSILKLLAQPTGEPQTGGLSSALKTLRRSMRPGTVIFILSDFQHVDHEAEQALSQFADHHELVAGFIYDPIERELPPAGHYGFAKQDMILGIDTGDRRLRSEYRTQFETHRHTIKKMCATRGISFLELPTDEDVRTKLQQRGQG